ncbi:DUF5397 family protein [Lichenifustis flavocetrariae]|uniref:DUF5397 domain-containing protein n=1 Tax=Lichenifustis flavocetrariae TaxID=2949735 RepID=A0AA41Z458_9HYPH|nr:DUF5397 family protein [Lichenifustis flavocetrariae]MCW6512465.1 DUF5397 domain-containing protein [Lichenifustis flavocetrariae]
MNAPDTLPLPLRPDGLVGTWRRFGTSGPVYEIVSIGATNQDGDSLVHIRVVETGEELDYRLSEVLDDPRER